MAVIGKVQDIKREFNFEWQIENFLSLPEEDGKSYTSPSFSFAGEFWHLRIYPHGESENDSVEYVGLYLIRNMSIHPITLVLFLGIKTVNQKKEHEMQIICVFDEKNGGYGTSKLLKRSTLAEKKSEFVPSDVLTIVCTVDSYFRTNDDTGNTMIAEYKKLLVGEHTSSHKQTCFDKPIQCPACNSVIALRVQFDHVCEAMAIKDDYLKHCKMKSLRKNESRSPSETCSHLHRKHKKHSSKHHSHPRSEACSHLHRKYKKHSSKHPSHSHSALWSDLEYVCCKHKSRRKKKHKSQPKSSSQPECKSVDTNSCSNDHNLKQKCYLRPSKLEHITKKEETKMPPLLESVKNVSHDSQSSDMLLKEHEGLLPLVTDSLDLTNLLLALPLPKPNLQYASHQNLLSHFKNSEVACQLLNTDISDYIPTLLDALDFTTVEVIELKEENSKRRSSNEEISYLLNCLIQKNPDVFCDSIFGGISPS